METKDKSIAQFEETLDGKTVKIEAVISGNTLEYHVLNKNGERSGIANDEGYGLLMAEKDENHNYIFGGMTIHHSHYKNPKQFFKFLRSLARFNYIAQHGVSEFVTSPEAENIKAFFSDSRRKLISVNEVEKMAGIPSATLKHFLNGTRSLPQHHQDAIVTVILQVGYQPAITPL